MMGYCFGADYIAVYRSAPEGDQLLGNSSNIDLLKTLPADLRGRVHFNEDQSLLGLRINNLTERDSGIYRRECWMGPSLVNQQTKKLTVCKEEFQAEEIIVNEEGGTQIICNSTSIGMAGVSVRWYHETYEAEQPELFLDSSVSLKPLIQDPKGVVEVKDKGTVLVLDKAALKSNLQFYCLVIEGKSCLSFQNIYKAESSDIKFVFASEGDREVLPCKAEDSTQQWATPLGEVSSTGTGDNQMHISPVESDFSLIIPAVANEHSGMYSCISASLEIQYSLLLCPKTKYLEKVGGKGKDVSLECHLSHDVSHRVLWYRHAPSEQYQVFSDSDDHSIPIPEDLSGRLTLSHYEYMLNISNLDTKDAGVYGCVILTSPEFIDGHAGEDGDDGDDGDYDEKETDDDYYSEGEACIFKQETVLSIEVGNSLVHVGGVIGGLAGLAVLVAVVVVIVKKKKRAASENPSNTKSTELTEFRQPLNRDEASKTTSA